MQEGLGYNLILVSAPAGFGKTTLLSDWARQNQPQIPTAWVSLDEGENDPVRFWDYFFGTGLGILVGTFIFTFFIGTLKEVWASGNWGQLLSFKVFFSVGLFTFSLFIPKIIKKVKGED